MKCLYGVYSLFFFITVNSQNRNRPIAAAVQLVHQNQKDHCVDGDE